MYKLCKTKIINDERKCKQRKPGGRAPGFPSQNGDGTYRAENAPEIQKR